jgi:hypothetical protein
MRRICQSFLYKCIACGFVVDKDFRRDFGFHELKIAHFAHIFSTTIAFSLIHNELRKAQEHDRRYKVHDGHITPKVFDKLKQNAVKQSSIIKLLKHAHRLKVDSMYVDIRDDKISMPFVKKKYCRVFLQLVKKCIDGFEVALQQTPEEFRDTAEWLDPNILKTGTIKFDFMPKGRFVFADK